MLQWMEWYEQVSLFCRQKEDELYEKAVRLRARGFPERARAIECLIGRLGEASRLIFEHKVFYAGGGIFYVESRSLPSIYHQVRKGHCDCEAGHFKIQCTHRLAAYLFIRGSRRVKRNEPAPEHKY